MFHAIKSEGRIAKWLGSMLVSTLAHAGLGFVVVAGSLERAPVKNIGRGIEVRLHPLPLPAPPAAPPAHQQRTARPTKLKVANLPLQPSRIPVPDKLPESTITDSALDDEGGVEGGVIGGVIGGVLGAMLGGGAGGQIAAPEGPPVLLGAGMTRPMPIGECSPAGTRPKPITPEQARRMSITGTVLVEYTVHSDGRVGEISMRNNGSPILFDAVEKWLVDCAFSPSLSGTKPIPVKIIQAFVFRTG